MCSSDLFDPALTQEQFHLFSAMVGQALFPSPVNPGDAGEFPTGGGVGGVRADGDDDYVRQLSGDG